jgi:hypothetical protein
MQKEVVYPLALRTYPHYHDSNPTDFHNCPQGHPIGIASSCGLHRVEFATSLPLQAVSLSNIDDSLEIIPSKLPLLGHVLEDCSISTYTNNAQPSRHKGYKGLDLQLQYNLENDLHVVFCDTYMHGSFEVFVPWSFQYDLVFCSPSSNLLFPRRDSQLL